LLRLASGVACSRCAFVSFLGFADFALPFVDRAFRRMAGIVFGDNPASIFVHNL
jgi:hypothetical protein